MALSNAERQRQYRNRAKQQGLIQLNSYVEADTSRVIDQLAAKLNAPRYAVLEHAVRKLAEAHEDRLNRA